MIEKYNLSIQNPCGQNFIEFSETKKGGFCDSCKQEVIDFTKMNDDSLMSYLKNTEGKTCGRFKPSQLKTYSEEINPIREKKQALGIGIASISLLSLLSINESKAQTNSEESIVTNKEMNAQHKLDVEHNSTLVTSVSGIVNADDIPLPGVWVHVKGTDISARTDFDGQFSIDITEDLKNGILVFSYIGYKTLEYKLPENLSEIINLNIQEDLKLENDLCVLGAVNVHKVYASKRTFWQKIKNWL